MIFKETKLKGSYIVEIEMIGDERGFFGRSWCEKEFSDHGLETNLKQLNVSYSAAKGTLRGLHYQKSPYQEAKLVRCVRGSIFDVIIDLRPDSETYKQWFGVELSEKNRKSIYVPNDFAHGFLTLEDNCEINYGVTEYYTPEYEEAVRWDDPSFDIKWPIKPTVITERDQNISNFV